MNYTIKQGKHYSNFTLNRLLPFTSTSIVGTFRLNANCWHERNSIEYTGWNKLTGIAQIFGVHQNSGRLVWQPDFQNKGKIQIAGYVYSGGGHWKVQPIMTIDVDKDYLFSIKRSYGYWLFTVNERQIMMAGNNPVLPVKCYPYFGGKSTAPHSMNINVCTQ